MYETVSTLVSGTASTGCTTAFGVSATGTSAGAGFSWAAGSAAVFANVFGMLRTCPMSM
ncbi:hypothetical protein [Sedimentibacter sp. B4]|uniref:hypothetical protein n=1 Tax=Sedimentibacter sp. B4 TaxID=304766 RepID=UPI001E450BA4|nr:hypothetical protein [Sedimentibacter sp. B4]